MGIETALLLRQRLLLLVLHPTLKDSFRLQGSPVLPPVFLPLLTQCLGRRDHLSVLDREHAHEPILHGSHLLHLISVIWVFIDFFHVL